MNSGGAEKKPHKKKPRKADKLRRNFRINGESRGRSPVLAASTKYVRSGGPRRAAERKAKAHGCGLPGLHLGKHGERDYH